jgi:membrane-associated phospholipid phosphatase
MEQATPRSPTRFAVDWLPLLLIAGAYGVLHEVGDSMVARAHVEPQLGFDNWLFGAAATVRLQDALWHGRAHVHWYDYATWLVYLSHFFVTLTIAIVLWKVAYPRFLKFRALILTVTFAGFVTYVIYPAFPPWLASIRGDMAPTVRVVREVWLHLGLSGVAAVFGEQSNYAFPVGALPSLHAAWPCMIVLFFWRDAGRWRILLVGYALAMALTLVYTADHFVLDILMGWAYAIAVYAGFSWFWRRRSRRAEEAAAPGQASSSLPAR